VYALLTAHRYMHFPTIKCWNKVCNIMMLLHIKPLGCYMCIKQTLNIMHGILFMARNLYLLIHIEYILNICLTKQWSYLYAALSNKIEDNLRRVVEIHLTITYGELNLCLAMQLSYLYAALSKKSRTSWE